mgnify:CR=1 FL=1
MDGVLMGGGETRGGGGGGERRRGRGESATKLGPDGIIWDWKGIGTGRGLRLGLHGEWNGS